MPQDTQRTKGAAPEAAERRGTLISMTKILPRSIGWAWFYVVFSTLLLAYAVFGLFYVQPRGFQLVLWVVIGLLMLTFVARSVNGLLTLRRERRE